MTEIEGKKIFANLEIGNVNFKKLNSIQAEDIILTSNLPIKLSESLTFLQPLRVEKAKVLKINNNVSLDDMVTVQRHYDGELLLHRKN